LWVLPVTPDGKPEAGAKPRPYLRSRFNESHGRFSPEHRPNWVAYHSDESGRNEIYLRTFPELHGKVQISSGGGSFPEWSPDGKELFYVARNKLMAVGLKLDAQSVVPSRPRELFAIPRGGAMQPFTTGPDGKRFLMGVPAGGAQPLEVVINWPALLKKGSK
jgi:hypothetical protein